MATINENVINFQTTDNHSEQEKGPKKQQRKRKGKTRTQRYKEKQPRPDYQPIVKDNENLVKYYQRQSFLLGDEFEKFMAGLRETLPASFRINTFDHGQAAFLRRLVQGPEFHEFLSAPVNSSLNDGEVDKSSDSNKKVLGQEQPSPPALEPLSWYPKRLGWQMNITRLDLKRTPILQQMHKFIMAETDNGFISRQEAVSMIPPLLLDVHRGQNILDMCAAPGSKTAQLLEYLKCDIMDSGELIKPSSGPTDDLFDDGIVVANDVDNKRCYMLVHQSSRLNSPNCIIINQDGARLPDMKTFSDDKPQEYTSIKFDRILCDVPCSGDGTVRKNPDVWRKWSVGNANNFHGMQCKILKRGVELLKENGLLVYSTCSMNPVEDEAVIASILRASQGRIALEEVANKLPGLKFKPGTSKWVVMNKDMQVISSVREVPPENATQIYPSLFQPSEEESKSFNLHKCIRILPHLQNTGGFFVAVLRKLSANLPWEDSAKESTTEKTKENPDLADKNRSLAPSSKKRRFGGFKEDPFIFMDESDPDWVSIKKGYGLSESFPVNQLIHRCTTGKKRSIYLVSKRTRNFIIANREEPDRRDFVKIINGGMRVFNRADTESGFRVCQDGVNEVLPYIKDDVKVPINKSDLVALLKARSVAFDSLSSGAHIREKIRPGSFILIYKHDGEDESERIEMPIVAWKGEWTIALYVANTYRIHLCALAQLRIGDNGIAMKQKEETGEEVKGLEEQ